MLKVTLIFSVFVTCSLADLTIELSSENDTISESLTWYSYQDMTPFRSQFVNISSLTGIIHSPEPSDACSYIEPLPSDILNDTFALIDNYPSCVSSSDMVTNVRNAGYKLIIASSPNDTHRSVTKELKEIGFPIAIVSEEYANYLRENATVTDINNIDYRYVIEATVTGSIVTSVAIVATVFSVLLLCCCCCCCFCLIWCFSCGRDRDVDRHIEEIEERRRIFEQTQRRERYARQELIESILRQLAELQVDLRSQVPLGDQATKRLPTRKYQAGQEKMESCAICVDEFSGGDQLRVLPCDHYFHSKCIDEWLINHSSLCPLCKKAVQRNEPQGASNSYGRINNFTSDDDSTSLLLDSSSSENLLAANRDRVEDRPFRYGSV